MPAETIDRAAKRLGAVILTGGRSPLFGPHDQLAEAARERLIEHLAWTLSEFPFAQFALAAASGAEKRPEGMTVLADEEAGLGPLGGIATALRRLPGGIFVAAGNMPQVSKETVEWLLSFDDPEAAAVIPRHSSGSEPFFAIYNKSLLPALEQALASGREGLGAALSHSGVRYIELPQRFPASLFTRVHTPKEYERALQALRATVR